MRDLRRSLETFFSWFIDAPIKTIYDLIQWNEEQADIELPQSKLVERNAVQKNFTR